MTSTTPTGVGIWTNEDPQSLPAASAFQASTLENILKNKNLNTFRWPTSTARGDQTGMIDGDLGVQTDNDTVWLYTGGQWESLISPSENYPVGFFGLTIGNGTVQSTFSQVGNRVFVEGSILFGSSTLVTGAVAVSLPVTESSFYTAASSQKYVGGCQILDAGVKGMGGFVYIAGAQPGFARLQRTVLEAPSGNVLQMSVNVGQPWTMSSGDIISWSFNYTRA